MATHWEAFMEIPKVLAKDYPSILFHAILSKVERSLEDWSRNAFPGSDMAPYLIEGFAYTTRQDYAASIFGVAGNIPDQGILGGAAARVNY